MEAPLFTAAEMSRQWAIADTIKAYNEELNFATENRETLACFNLKDPSKAFITAKQLRDFHAWCPVSLHTDPNLMCPA